MAWMGHIGVEPSKANSVFGINAAGKDRGDDGNRSKAGYIISCFVKRDQKEEFDAVFEKVDTRGVCGGWWIEDLDLDPDPEHGQVEEVFVIFARDDWVAGQEFKSLRLGLIRVQVEEVVY